VWDGTSGTFVDAPVYRQGAMAVETGYTGPMIVEQRETTAVLGAGDGARVDGFGNLVIRVGA
jgi:N-methylhydantoinase A